MLCSICLVACVCAASEGVDTAPRVLCAHETAIVFARV